MSRPVSAPDSRCAEADPLEERLLAGYFEELLIPRDPPGPIPSCQTAAVPTAEDAATGTGEAAAQDPSGCPGWAGETFPVQRFRLGTLHCAAPAEQLVGVFALEARIPARAGQCGWRLGRVNVAGREVWVASPAALIVPGKPVLEPYQWLLLPRSGEVALACQGVDGPLRWRAGQVHWRTVRIRRPWLLGMRRDPPCPLIDVEVLVSNLPLGG